MPFVFSILKACGAHKILFNYLNFSKPITSKFISCDESLDQFDRFFFLIKYKMYDQNILTPTEIPNDYLKRIDFRKNVELFFKEKNTLQK